MTPHTQQGRREELLPVGFAIDDNAHEMRPILAIEHSLKAMFRAELSTGDISVTALNLAYREFTKCNRLRLGPEPIARNTWGISA